MLIREKLVYECSCSAACVLSFLLDVGVYLSLIISFLENSVFSRLGSFLHNSLTLFANSFMCIAILLLNARFNGFTQFVTSSGIFSFPVLIYSVCQLIKLTGLICKLFIRDRMSVCFHFKLFVISSRY